MRKQIVIVALFAWVGAQAEALNPDYLSYISQYKQTAINQEIRHGIPACITLAQGLLESGAGKSMLATEGNNHFGIKCHDWTGETLQKDDDQKDDCFRKYATASESYEDHSLFLLRPRYSTLFELETIDYKGWAKGLKQCGYATDPQYAKKLVKIIEDYDLAKISGEALLENETAAAEAQIMDEVQSMQPDSHQDSTRVAVTYEREVDLYVGHVLKREKGKRYVIAEYGDSYEAIAAEYMIEVKRILRYNKAKKGDKPAAGARVKLN